MPKTARTPSASRAPASAPDVQAAAAPRAYKLTRVGVRGVKKPVTVHRPKQKPTGVVATFDLFVDLPKTQKGTHMSRNLEALADILDEEVAAEAPSLENLCRRVTLRLLEKHGYANHAHAKAEADYFLTRTNPSGKATIEAYRLLAEADAVRGSGKSKTTSSRRVGVQVIGMSACPCAMETARHQVAERGKAPAKDLPFITHNQRNVVTILLDLPGDADVEAAGLVEVAESALSAPTFELLKRGDEGALVIQAHDNPRFVEDVVREAIHLLASRYGKLGDLAVFVSSEAQESIHKHNAYAERHTTLGAAE